MSEFKDPLYEWGKRQQEEGMNRALQGCRQTAQYERMLQNKIFHFLTIGIVEFLWQRSRTTLFLFLIPFWLYVFSWIGVVGATSAVRNSEHWGAIIGFGLWGMVCLALMGLSMWWGYRKTLGVCRWVAIAQIVTAGLFTLVATFRAITANSNSPAYAPESFECVMALLFMLLLFAVAVVADLIQAFQNRRTGE